LPPASSPSSSQISSSTGSADVPLYPLAAAAGTHASAFVVAATVDAVFFIPPVAARIAAAQFFGHFIMHVITRSGHLCCLGAVGTCWRHDWIRIPAMLLPIAGFFLFSIAFVILQVRSTCAVSLPASLAAPAPPH